MSENKLSLGLYKKIQDVSIEIMNLEKDMDVGSSTYGYKAVSDIQVTIAVKKAEKKHGLVSIPIKQELISQETLKVQKDSKSETLKFIDNIKMTVRIINLEDGNYVDVESFGKGIDTGDKGFGKASTYARKYALLNAYKIATGEDPDANKSPQDIVNKAPSEKRIAIEGYFSKNMDQHNNLLSYYNKQEIAELTEPQVEQTYNTLLQKKLI